VRHSVRRSGETANDGRLARHRRRPAPVGEEPGEAFPSWAAAGAVLATIFAPFISLIVAVVMYGNEKRLRRRGFLKNWAIGSAAWLGVGALIFVGVFASAGGGGCKGGRDPFALPSYESSDNVRWQETVACVNGGQTTFSVPASKVPGNGGSSSP
jgi:hypothetical protein